MDENTHSDHSQPPSSPETDYSTNPTDAAPDSGGGQWEAASQGAAFDGATSETERPRAAAGREMLVQLQQMIDTMATQAGPVMREVAAKAAELAAIAGEKAGPLAHKAAGVTESVGQRVAARSKDFAADLRRPNPGTSSDQDTADWPSEPPRNTDD